MSSLLSFLHTSSLLFLHTSSLLFADARAVPADANATSTDGAVAAPSEAAGQAEDENNGENSDDATPPDPFAFPYRLSFATFELYPGGGGEWAVVMHGRG